MPVKTLPNEPSITNYIAEEFKDPNLKYNLSKFEYDLYHEEDDITEKIIRVKRFSLPNNGERWKIFEDNKVVFVIEGAKLTKKEKSFLRSVDGVNFLISQYKTGINSFTHLKTEIKKKINSQS
jgi:hypothetical protein